VLLTATASDALIAHLPILTAFLQRTTGLLTLNQDDLSDLPTERQVTPGISMRHLQSTENRWIHENFDFK
jgi:hypothetical protein